MRGGVRCISGGAGSACGRVVAVLAQDEFERRERADAVGPRDVAHRADAGDLPFEFLLSAADRDTELFTQRAPDGRLIAATVTECAGPSLRPFSNIGARCLTSPIALNHIGRRPITFSGI